MPRFLFKTLTSQSGLLLHRSLLSSFRLLNHRVHSSKAEKVHLIEIDLPSAAAAATEGGGGNEESEFKEGMRKLEDAIHVIMAVRSAPDWLPFIPGSSYWVPPAEKLSTSCTYKVVELVKRLRDPITEEEAMSLTTVRGWPSTAFFIEGKEGSPHAPVDESTEKTKALKTDDDA